LAIIKHAVQKPDMERLNLGKLNELEVREQYHIKTSNRFAALENLKMIGRTYKGLGKTFKRISKPQLMTV